MACDAQTFEGISLPMWARMQSEVQRQLGMTIAADSGQASEKGFTVSWHYNASAGTLTIRCLEKPFFVPCAMFNAQVGKLIAELPSA